MWGVVNTSDIEQGLIGAMPFLHGVIYQDYLGVNSLALDGLLATSSHKMCPFGGTDPKDRGRAALAAKGCPPPSLRDTSSSGGQGACFGLVVVFW